MTNSKRLRQLLFALVMVLTFEGIARKASPSEFNVPLFLLKDVLVALMGMYVWRQAIPPSLKFLWNAYKTLAVLFIPLVLFTAWHDPVLAVFGLKEYLLYPIVAFATFLAFQYSPRASVLRFFRWCSLLLIPTVSLSLIQIRLPYDHWLNMSVTGESLRGFGAADMLRVSSTFSFVAQYCAFLNAQVFIVMMAFLDWRQIKLIWKAVYCSLVPLLVVSCFITGSRGAVVGIIAIILLAGGLALMKLQFRHVFHIVSIMIGLYLSALILNYLYPDATAAYSARENGHLVGISSEIQERVLGSFQGLSGTGASTAFMGYGIGVMSNGSDTISSYADSIREYIWTEGDFSCTLFEGGYYLAFIWYGFRLYVIWMTTRRFLKEVTGIYVVPGAFVQGYIIVVGMLGTLGTQPPIAIWWWLGVGTSHLLWWKCVGPQDIQIITEGMPPPPPKKITRGRSMYAETLHRRK